MKKFFEPIDYKKYLLDTKLYTSLNMKLSEVANLKFQKNLDLSKKPDPLNLIPYDTEWDDLIRLHFIVRTRKVTSILEFGIGKSTFVLDHALSQNKRDYSKTVNKNIRRENPFVCHSVDDDEYWFNEISKNGNTQTVNYYFSNTYVSTFNDRICTYYEKLPNVCPDLIYLDGPDQFSIKGEVRGISTRNPDRLPMAGDLLAIEHFLLPGTLIVIDGRTANARFLKSNFQRDWYYYYDHEFDQHFFELLEEPLGIYNKTQIEFCLGNSYFQRLKDFQNSKNERSP